MAQEPARKSTKLASRAAGAGLMCSAWGEAVSSASIAPAQRAANGGSGKLSNSAKSQRRRFGCKNRNGCCKNQDISITVSL